MLTRKTLVPFDLINPDRSISGFLYPNVEKNPISSFLEIKTGKEWAAGMVVLVGREISKEDIFAKIVDSGKEVFSVRGLLSSLDDYLHQVATFKIGDVLGVKSSSDGFELIKLDRPARPHSRLPK